MYSCHLFLISSASVADAADKSLQSCLTLCDPIDGSPPGFPIPGILQARTLEWVAIAFSIGDAKNRQVLEELYQKKDLQDPDNHNGVITHQEPDILE